MIRINLTPYPPLLKERGKLTPPFSFRRRGRGMRLFVLTLFLIPNLQAEEILSSHPLVVSPKRIETETTVPGKTAKRSLKTNRAKAAPSAPAPESEEQETGVAIE